MSIDPKILEEFETVAKGLLKLCGMILLIDQMQTKNEPEPKTQIMQILEQMNKIILHTQKELTK